jgi:hypothetical protein
MSPKRSLCTTRLIIFGFIARSVNFPVEIAPEIKEAVGDLVETIFSAIYSFTVLPVLAAS